MIIAMHRTDASPLNHRNKFSQEAKEQHFNKTVAAKIRHLTKAESALNKTLSALTDPKKTFDDAKTQLATKIGEKVSRDVEKWAAIGDAIHKKEVELMAKVANKFKSSTHFKSTTTSISITKAANQESSIQLSQMFDIHPVS